MFRFRWNHVRGANFSGEFNDPKSHIASNHIFPAHRFDLTKVGWTRVQVSNICYLRYPKIYIYPQCGSSSYAGLRQFAEDQAQESSVIWKCASKEIGSHLPLTFWSMRRLEFLKFCMHAEDVYSYTYMCIYLIPHKWICTLCIQSS